MSLRHALRSLVSSNVANVRAINARYAHPRLAVSPAVRLSLLALRLYMLVLVGLLGYRFITTVMQ